MDLKEIGWEGEGLIHVPQDLVRMVNYLLTYLLTYLLIYSTVHSPS